MRHLVFYGIITIYFILINILKYSMGLSFKQYTLLYIPLCIFVTYQYFLKSNK